MTTEQNTAGITADSSWEDLMADPVLSSAICWQPDTLAVDAGEAYADIYERMRRNAEWLRPVLNEIAGASPR
jgi:hypothetical protein